MSEVAILVPVLGRPHRVQPCLDAIFNNTPKGFSVHFICDPQDGAEIQAIEADGRATIHTPGGSYAAKINYGVRATTEPLVIFFADDLEPKPDWYEIARANLDDQIQAVGIKDLVNRPHRPEHTTIFLATRDYALRPTLNDEKGPMAEVYDHSFVDDEFIATAKRRGVYVYEPEARVLHLHPDMHTAPMDATYVKGRERFFQDRQVWRHRENWYLEKETAWSPSL